MRFADPERIREAVRRYALAIRASHPEIRSIRWFGSWVRGDPTVGSDVDLCVIVGHSDKPRRERLPDFLPREFPVGIDLFVYTVDEYDALRSDHPAMIAAMEAGVEV